MTAPKVDGKPEQVKRSSPKEFAVRFVFGGVITAVVGVLAKLFGPVVAGLFLAFPAILPASLTLVAKHEDQRAAATEACGAALGSVGLATFGAVVWLLAPITAGWIVLLAATTVWLVVSVALWLGWEWYQENHRPVDHRSQQPVESSVQRWGVAKR